MARDDGGDAAAMAASRARAALEARFAAAAAELSQNAAAARASAQETWRQGRARLQSAARRAKAAAEEARPRGQGGAGALALSAGGGAAAPGAGAEQRQNQAVAPPPRRDWALGPPSSVVTPPAISSPPSPSELVLPAKAKLDELFEGLQRSWKELEVGFPFPGNGGGGARERAGDRAVARGGEASSSARAGEVADVPGNGPLQRAASKRRQQREDARTSFETARPQKGPKKAQKRSLREEGSRVAVVTTASLPWMTGTSVNPLLRAAYLAKDGTRQVTLVMPWLPPADQRIVHPKNLFSSPGEQESFVREWVKERCGFEPKLEMRFYPGRYATDKGSILPVGDLTSAIPDASADIAVLEEPEHLNWYHHGQRWTDKFAHVVGVIHTNYLEYARREENGELKEKALRAINSLVCRAHCDKVVKLSGAVQDLPRSETCFVHGVSPRFLEVGRAKAEAACQRACTAFQNAATASVHTAAENRRALRRGGTVDAAAAATPASSSVSAAAETAFPKGVYFIGKVVWAKGYTELLSLFKREQGVRVDVYGNGDDFDAVRQRAAADGLAMTFHGAKDHGDAEIHDYKVFVNPSLSDVVATTTAEALAMGKFVVVAEHPSNAFFSTFDNCLTYRTPEEFSAAIRHALDTEPKPLSDEDRYRLSWEAATERFMDAAEPVDLPDGRRAADTALDWTTAQVHGALTGVEGLRGLCGAGVHTLHAPADLASWEPEPWGNQGGFFDRKEPAPGGGKR